MGCSSSKDGDDTLASKHSCAIDEQIKRENGASKEIRILFLGTGEGGKSTVLNQFELISGRQYSRDERLDYKDVIYLNTIQSMQACIEAYPLLDLQIPDHLYAASTLLTNLGRQPEVIEDDGSMRAEIRDALILLRDSDSLKHVLTLSHLFQLNDSAPYFFDALERICLPKYIPDETDILRARIKSTGIKEVKFKSGPLNINAIDVGGQRSERRKWLAVFENIQVVLFVVAISEFNQKLYEDSETNRLEESIVLWESIVNSKWFQRSTMILFLNKIDLFREKLQRFELADWMEEYTGDNSFESASKFILQTFLARSRSQERSIHGHLTCATDRKQIEVILQAVVDSLISQNLNSIGMF